MNKLCTLITISLTLGSSYTLAMSDANAASANLNDLGLNGLLFNFNDYVAGENPNNWIDTNSNAMTQNDSLFVISDINGEKVLGTTSINDTNIHSHYVDDLEQWSDYRYTGRMKITGATDSIGVTFYSDYPNTDTYYRLRSEAGGSFYISPHGSGIECTGNINTGVYPIADKWFEFKIEVESLASETNIKANVWEEGTNEPTNWQVDCVDTDTRITAGSIGLWSVIQGKDVGNKYWDDLKVVSLNAEANPGVIVSDSDSDGMTDSWEIEAFGDLDTADATTDFDNDGVLDVDEMLFNTDPLNNDSDGDGSIDGEEIASGSNPNLSVDTPEHELPSTPLIYLTEQYNHRNAVFEGSRFSGAEVSNTLFFAHWMIVHNDTVVFSRKVEKNTQLNLPAGILQYGETYGIKVRYFDNNLIASQWSEIISFDVSSNSLTDFDEDGVDDFYQVSQNIDINNNSIPDSDENICHLKTADGTGAIGIKALTGVANCQTIIPADTLASEQLESKDIPYGLINFSISGLETNLSNPASVIVRMHLPDSSNSDSGWAAYDKVTGSIEDASNLAQHNGKVVTLYLQDGSENDVDGTINGVIVSPGGVTTTSAESINITLDEEDKSGNYAVTGATGYLEFFLMILILSQTRRYTKKLACNQRS